ncbi:MAG: ATP synthase F0 subunit A, partial [Raoultibacter sp.]
MNALETLASEVPHLQHSFDPAYVFGSGFFGMTQYVFWMLICVALTMIVVMVVGRRLTLVPSSKFVNMVE